MNQTDLQNEEQKLAAVLGILEPRNLYFDDALVINGNLDANTTVTAQVFADERGLEDLEISGSETNLSLSLSRKTFSSVSKEGLALYREKMARFLYCLGVEDEEILNRLNSPLTAHEKVELQRSLPEMFWPTAWNLDVEASGK